MATLSDLFVSYKSVQPEQTETPDAQSGLANLPLVRGRLQQIENAHRQSMPEPDDTPEELSEQESEVTVDDNPKAQFKWLMQSPSINPQWPLQLPQTSGGYTSYNPLGVMYNRGQLDKEVKELFERAGINVQITSGKRPAGAAGKAGSRSHHVGGNAVDIIPGKGETFDSIRQKMSTHPEILQFFADNKLGIIDETTPETMKRTGATGKHFHIGPDLLALQTWSTWIKAADTTPKASTQQEWARNVQSAFAKGLKEEYGSKYNPDTYSRIATYMTYQAALESGYGKKANGFNYSGHMRNGKTIHYKTMDEFVKAHIKTLQKWDFMSANSLQEYVNSLYQGKSRYNAHDSESNYYAAINGTVPRVNRYLGLKAKFGGKFKAIRQLHEQSFS